MANFHTEFRLKSQADIQRKYMYEFVVPGIARVSPGTKEDDLIVRCKQVSIPGRGNEVIESNFMGMKQLFPGRMKFNGVINLTFEETEDMKVMKTFYNWRELIMGANPSGVNPGFGGAANKRAVALDSYIRMIKYNGDPTDFQIKVVNCWPSDVSDGDLAMAANEAVSYNVALSFDFWVLVKGG